MYLREYKVFWKYECSVKKYKKLVLHTDAWRRLGMIEQQRAAKMLPETPKAK